MSYNFLFQEYAKKWKIDFGTVRIIFLILDLTKHYSETSKALNQLGFKIKTRQLRYFYKKVVLTERYGTIKDIGSDNYRRLIYKKI